MPTTRKSSAGKLASENQVAQTEDEALDKFLELVKAKEDEESRINRTMDKIRSKYKKIQDVPSEDTLRDLAMRFLNISNGSGVMTTKDVNAPSEIHYGKTSTRNNKELHTYIADSEDESEEQERNRAKKKRRIEKVTPGDLATEFQHTVFPQGGVQATQAASVIKTELRLLQQSNKSCRSRTGHPLELNLHFIRTKCARVKELALGSYGTVSTLACAKEPERLNKFEVDMLTEYTTEMIVATVLLKYPHADVKQVESDASTMLQKNLTSNALKIRKKLTSHSVIMKTWNEVADKPKRSEEAFERKVPEIQQASENQETSHELERILEDDMEESVRKSVRIILRKMNLTPRTAQHLSVGEIYLKLKTEFSSMKKKNGKPYAPATALSYANGVVSALDLYRHESQPLARNKLIKLWMSTLNN